MSRFICFSMLLNAVLISTDCVGEANTDVSNERLPFTGLQLEEHWQIDCGQTSKELTLAIAAFLHANAGTDQYAVLAIKGSEMSALFAKCGFIYNTARNSRYSLCPDYLAARIALDRWLNLAEAGRLAKNGKELLREVHHSLNCIN